MHTRQRDRGVAFVRALAADPTAVLRAPADASAAEANASEAAAPDDATSRLGALAHAASVQKPKRKTKLVSDSPEARRARAKVIFAVAKKRRFEHEQRAAAAPEPAEDAAAAEDADPVVLQSEPAKRVDPSTLARVGASRTSHVPGAVTRSDADYAAGKLEIRSAQTDDAGRLTGLLVDTLETRLADYEAEDADDSSEDDDDGVQGARAARLQHQARERAGQIASTLASAVDTTEATRSLPRHVGKMSVPFRTLRDIVGDAVPDITLPVGSTGVFAIDGSLVLIWLLMVAMRIAVRSGVVGDCEENAKPRGAPYSKHAGYEDIPYSYSHTAHFLTAVNKWSAIHGFPNPLEGVY